MTVKLLRKSGHKFFEFSNNGVTRTLCVDGWINSKICPSFCHPELAGGWQPMSDKCEVFESSDSYTVVCPTCFGFVSRRGFYRKTGAFHMDLVLDKSAFMQYLYNYTL